MMGYGTYEPVELLRDCKAIQIPDGVPVVLKAGDAVFITQVLGGMFTVETDEGYLARIDGLDADAMGHPVPDERLRTKQAIASGLPLHDLVWAELRSCYDPEVPANIVDLGLIYGCELTNREDGSVQVDIQMTLTAPGCGMGNVLKTDVEQRLLELPSVAVVNVELVFEPPWTRERMSEAAKLQLGML